MGTFRCSAEVYPADGARSENMYALPDTGNACRPRSSFCGLGITLRRRIQSGMAHGWIVECTTGGGGTTAPNQPLAAIDPDPFLSDE
jgi:hypothetical protein